MTRLALEAMPIIPRVVINGLTLMRVIIVPLIAPTSAPTASATTMAGHMFQPLCSSSPTTTPLRASTEPTDRSKPPVIRTIVIAMAMMASVAKPMVTAVRFEEFIK